MKREDISCGGREEGETRRRRQMRLMRHAMAEELTSRQKEVLRLCYEEGLSGKEVAARLGVAPSTVSRTRARALARLRRYLHYCE